MRIGLASPPFPASLAKGVERVNGFIREAREQSCDLVCFPEAYLPGLRDQGYPVEPYDHARQELALQEVRRTAGELGVAVVLGMEWEGRLVAFVIDRSGDLVGCQSKNQIAPEEEPFYTAGDVRRLFSIDGVPFGIAICHEGWRYPETVRWAAARGARLVFHPNCTSGEVPARFGDTFYEKALICRAAENTIFVASVNYALPDQVSATCVVAPSGECVAYLPHGQEGLLVCDLDLEQATGLLASRYRPDLYATDPEERL